MVVTGTAGQTDGRLHGPVLDSVAIAVSSHGLPPLAITTLCLCTEPIDEVLLEHEPAFSTSLDDSSASTACSVEQVHHSRDSLCVASTVGSCL